MGQFFWNRHKTQFFVEKNQEVRPNASTTVGHFNAEQALVNKSGFQSGFLAINDEGTSEKKSIVITDPLIPYLSVNDFHQVCRFIAERQHSGFDIYIIKAGKLRKFSKPLEYSQLQALETPDHQTIADLMAEQGIPRSHLLICDAEMMRELGFTSGLDLCPDLLSSIELYYSDKKSIPPHSRLKYYLGPRGQQEWVISKELYNKFIMEDGNRGIYICSDNIKSTKVDMIVKQGIKKLVITEMECLKDYPSDFNMSELTHLYIILDEKDNSQDVFSNFARFANPNELIFSSKSESKFPEKVNLFQVIDPFKQVTNLVLKNNHIVDQFIVENQSYPRVRELRLKGLKINLNKVLQLIRLFPNLDVLSLVDGSLINDPLPESTVLANNRITHIELLKSTLWVAPLNTLFKTMPGLEILDLNEANIIRLENDILLNPIIPLGEFQIINRAGFNTSTVCSHDIAENQLTLIQNNASYQAIVSGVIGDHPRRIVKAFGAPSHEHIAKVLNDLPLSMHRSPIVCSFHGLQLDSLNMIFTTNLFLGKTTYLELKNCSGSAQDFNSLLKRCRMLIVLKISQDRNDCRVDWNQTEDSLLENLMLLSLTRSAAQALPLALLKAKNLRYLSFEHCQIDSDIDSLPVHESIKTLELNNVSFTEPRVLTVLLEKFPNCHDLTVLEISLTSDQIASAILHSKHKFKNKFLKELGIKSVPLIIQKNPVYLYDDERIPSDSVSMHHGSDSSVRKMIPLVRRLNGRPPAFSKIRNAVYQLPERMSSQQILMNYVQPILEDYHFLSPQHRDDLYEFDYEVNSLPPAVNGRVTLRLKSLSLSDRLISLQTHPDLVDSKIHFSKSDAFYYLSFKAPPALNKCRLTFQVEAPRLDPAVFPEKIMRLINQFKVEFRKDITNMPERKKTERLADHIMKNAAYYRCEVRAVGFYYKVKDLLKSNSVPGLQDCRLAKCTVHAWIELKINDEWHSINLGGAPTSMEYLPVQEVINNAPNNSNAPEVPAPQSTQRKRKQETIKQIKTMNEFEYLISQRGKRIFVFKSLDDLEQAGSYLKTRNADASCYFVDSFKDLNLTTPSIHVDLKTDHWSILPATEGYFSKRLKSINSFVINWSGFSARQTAQSNQWISPEQSHPLISLILQGDARLKDPSFVTRHEGVYLVETLLPLANRIENSNESKKVELYASPRWREILLGKLVVHGTERKFEPGFLLKQYNPKDILEQSVKKLKLDPQLDNSQEPTELILNNSPDNSLEFKRFVSDLEQGRKIRFYDQDLQFPIMKVSLHSGHDYSPYTEIITSVDFSQQNIDYVISPSTVERALYSHGVNDRGELFTEPGWIASHKGETISCYLISRLNPMAYQSLLREAKTHGKKLALHLAPKMILPQSMTSLSIPEFIQPDSPQDLKIVDPKTDWVIDVSEMAADELLYRYDYEFNIETQSFVFKQTVSDILQRLSQGNDVYLTGKFTPEMIDHLASLLIPEPYIWMNNQKTLVKGKLYLIPSKPDPRLEWVRPDRFAQDPSPIKQKSRVYAGPTHNDRVTALWSILNGKENPAVLIEGPPGIGKSCFVRSLELKANIYRESQLQVWALDQGVPDKYSILVIDEATLRESDWTLFKGLYQHHPFIMIKGKRYPLGPHHKVVFLGNTLKKIPALFLNVVPSLHFQAMTREMILDMILEPIFREQFPHDSRSRAEQFLGTKSLDQVRELHAQAIAACAQNLPPKAPLKDYLIIPSRQEVYHSILECLRARDFMQSARSDSSRYGGQNGIWIEGPAGAGKTDIIKAALRAQAYPEDQICIIGADEDPSSILAKLRIAFDQGLMVVIDEFDTAINTQLLAELNSYLMGEDLEGRRPQKPGFTLFATGNGLALDGREPLPNSLRSRLKTHKLAQYTKEECFAICTARFPEESLQEVIKAQIEKYLESPEEFGFRQLIESLKAKQLALNTSTGQPLHFGYAQRLSTPANLSNASTQISAVGGNTQGLK